MGSTVNYTGLGVSQIYYLETMMRKRILRDRNDGYYLTKLDPIARLIPYIMRERTDAHVYFQERISLDKVEPFLKAYRREHKVKIGFMHLMVAAMVRAMSQKPKINRFVAGNKIYARNHIAISYMIMKKMSENGSETAIKNYYKPEATLHDVVNLVNEDVSFNKNEDSANDTDGLAKLLNYMPGFVLRFAMGLIRWSDAKGILPKSILEASPFHTSMFITNLGSLGIKAAYHHIYNIGTTSLFLAFGIKEKKIVKVNGVDVVKKYIDIKIVADERIVDGYYYANTMKLAIKYLENPELLLLPPVRVVEDSEI